MTIRAEKKIIRKMIDLFYIKYNKGDKIEYKELLRYAIEKLTKCPFGDKKKACSKCHVHCYQPEKRKEIRKVMRFSGPRMLIYHPISAIRHVLDI